MKKMLLALVCLTMLWPGNALAYEGTISVKPLESWIMVDSEIKVDIRASGLKNVYAASFEIQYNNRLLQFKSLDEGAFLKNEPKPIFTYRQKIDANGGRIYVGISMTDRAKNLPESGTAFTLKFKGIVSGVAKIKIENLKGRRSNFDEISLKGEDGEFTIKENPTKPILNVDPTELDFGTLKVGETNTLKVKVFNTGKDGLSGDVECQNIWLSAKPSKFSSDQAEIAITVAPKDTQDLIVNKRYNGIVSIFTNGGSKDVQCKFYLQDTGGTNTVPPDLSIDEPKDGAVLNKGNIQIKGRTNPGAKIYMNGIQQPTAPDGAFVIEYMLLEGENKITLKATNDANLETTKTITVRLDSVKPALSVKDPGAVVHSSTLCVEGTSEPGATIRAGGKPVTVDKDGKFRICFELNKGSNSLQITVSDLAGNETTWTKSVNYVAQEIVKITMWVGNPKALVNGSTIYLEAPPQIKNNRTFVPVRFVSQNFRATVNWDGATRSVEVIGREHKCIVSIDNQLAFLDGKVVKLEAAPYIQGKSTMVPLRFIAQDTLGAAIEYDSKDKRIDLTLIFELK